MEELNRNIEEIILRHLIKEASDEEQLILLNWLKNDTENVKHFFTVKTIWEASQKNVQQQFNTEESWENVKNILSTRKTIDLSAKRNRLNSFLKYAAVAVVLIGFSFIAFKFGNKIFNKEIPVTYTEIKTPFGQKKQIILPDGTDVWINSGSTFKYASNYGENNREVYLLGEAYFNVTKDKTKTFVVRTDNITIKVLGTSFNVKCYPELKEIETTVITGIVSLQDNKTDEDVVIINKREKATYVKDQQKMYISKNSVIEDNKSNVEPIELKKITLSEEEADYISSWKDQSLSFNNETFEEMAFKLQHWFNVKITIKDEKLRNYRYKGKFDDIKSIFQVLEVIKLTTPISYDYNEKNKEIIIKETKN